MTTNAKEKREITPHKGGRTDRFNCRIHPDVKDMLIRIAEFEGVSPADLLEMWTVEKGKKYKENS